MADGLEPGWYPNTDGSRRYWDGVAWLDIPEPERADPDHQGTTSPRRTGIVVAVISAVVVIVAGIAVAVSIQNKNAEDDRRAAAAEQAQEKQEAAKRAAAAKQAAEDAERSDREDLVSQVESSVRKMARGHAKDGLLDAAPLKGVDANCEPVDGSFDDLLAPTTTFKCFVPTEEAEGGMYSGFNYHATVNWESGQYTYGMGQP